jgi:EmrB/QacA subfamily drug resistance transporter
MWADLVSAADGQWSLAVPLFRPGSTFVALIVAFAYFMENLDGAAITIILPQIADTFRLSATAASLGITAYMVSLAIFLAMSGWAADRFGPRNVFCLAIAAFAVASAACALSPSFWMFVVARTIQGIAAAFMSPVGRVIVLRTAPKSELMYAFGITVWPGLIAPIVGQPLAGLVTTYLSWQWVFLFNVPLALIGIALLMLCVDNRKEAGTFRLDVVGLGLTAVSLAALLYALDRLSHDTSSLGLPLGLIAVGVLSGLQAIRHAHGHDAPLIDVNLARIRSFAATSIWGGTFFRVAMGASPFLLPLLFQIGFGMTAFHASLLMLAYAAGNLVMKAATNQMLRRFGFRRILMVNGIVVVISVLAFATLVPGVPAPVVIGVLLFAGLTRSLQFTSLNTLAYAEIPHGSMSNASALQSMVQQIAFAFGIALGAVVLSVSASLRGAGPASIQVVDFQVAFVVAALFTAAAMPSLKTLAHDVGDEVSGYSGRRAAE